MKNVIQQMEEKYLPQAYKLWEQAPNVQLCEWETEEHIQAGLRSKTLKGWIGLEDGNVVAAMLIGHDGVRVYVHHYAVSQERRVFWEPSKLLRRALDDVDQTFPSRRLLATTSDERLIPIMERYGFVRQEEVVMQKDFKGIVAPPAEEAPLPTGAADLFAYIVRRLWTKHPIAAILAILLSLIIPIVTFDPGPGSLLARGYDGLFDKDTTTSIQPALVDPTTDFDVVSRTDILDLDALRFIPTDRGLEHRRISPGIRNSLLTVKRLNRGKDLFHFHAFSSSAAQQDLVCLTEGAKESRVVEWKPPIGTQSLGATELPIQASQWTIGAKNNVHVQIVGWNKYSGSNNRWASMFADHAVGNAVFQIDFPAGKVSKENLKFMRRKYLLKDEPDHLKNWEELKSPDVEFREDRALLTWKIGRIEHLWEYAVEWPDELVDPVEPLASNF